MNNSKNKSPFYFFLAALIVTSLYMWWMRNEIIPLSSRTIIEFELAKTVERSQIILRDLARQELIALMAKSLWIDFGFIILYTGLFHWGLRFFGFWSKNELMRGAGNIFSWFIPLAGAADAIENISLLQIIYNGTTQTKVSLAYIMATGKFSLLIIAILFMVVCVVFGIANRLWKEKDKFKSE